jgi:type I restriction enzyme S subunit
LRFPEFSGEWKEVKLYDVGTFVTDRISSNKLASSTYVSTENLQQNYGGKLDALNVPNNQNVIRYKTADILLSNIRPYLKKIWKADNNGGCSADVLVLRAKSSDCTPEFLYYTIANDKFITYVMSGAKGAKMPRGDKQHIQNYTTSIPSLPEQNKIYQLLHLLDERIATQKKVIEKLQSLIGGIYKSIFADIDCSFRLDEICEIRKGQQVNGTELFEDGEYYVMNGGVEPSGCYDKFNTPANTISISEGGNSCGYVQFNNRPFWSGGHCYTLRNVNLQYNLRFLYHYLKANESEIMKLRIGSGLPNIQKKDLASYCVPAIEMKEQIKIAQLLNSIQSRIDISCKLLDSYERQKTYLLSTMFI